MRGDIFHLYGENKHAGKLGTWRPAISVKKLLAIRNLDKLSPSAVGNSSPSKSVGWWEVALVSILPEVRMEEDGVSGGLGMALYRTCSLW